MQEACDKIPNQSSDYVIYCNSKFKDELLEACNEQMKQYLQDEKETV